MESEIKDLLGQVLQHLNKLQQTQDLQQHRLSQLDHVTERLDTVQNVLETQNQRQGLLNEKLDQVNILLREQLRYAQSDILTGITVLQSKLCSDGGREHVSQSVQKDQVPQDKNDKGPQLEDIVNSFHSRLNRLDTKVDILTNQLSKNLQSKEDHVPQAKNYMGSQFEDIVSSFHGRLDRLNTKVETVTNLLSDNEQSSHKLIGISQKIETQLQSAVRNMQQELGSQERTVTKQKEVQELQDVIKAQTRSELVWLERKIDLAVADMFAKLNEKLEMVHTKVTEQEKMSDHVQNMLCKQQHLLHNISSARETMEDKLVQVKEVVDNNEQQLRTVDVKIVNTEEGIKDLTQLISNFLTELTSGLSVSSVDDNIKTEFEGFCGKMKEEVISKIEMKQTETEKFMDQALDEIRHHLIVGNKSTDEIRQNFSTKSDNMLTETEKHLKVYRDEVKTLIEATSKESVSEIFDNFQIFVKNETMNMKQEMLNEMKETNKEMLVLAENNLRSHTDTASTGMKSDLLDFINTYLSKCDNLFKTINEDLKTRSEGQTKDCCKILVDLTTRKNTEQQEYTKQELMESVDKIKDHLDKVKYEMFAVTEKEAQLVRDYIENNVPLKQKLHQKQETYTFDFYVPGFKSLIKSGKIVKSFPWHIRKFKTSVQGYVQFLITGEMVVWLIYFRNPLEVGLAPRTCGTLHIRALVTDIYNKNLEDVNIGEINGTFNEEEMKGNSSRGYDVGTFACEDLVQKGYGEKEGYEDGAILIRYFVNVP